MSTEVLTLASGAASVEELAEQFIDTTPPMVAAREGMPAETFEAFADDVRKLIRERCREANGSASLVSEYMLIVARKRG